jgi:hypothetical protein
MEDNTHFSVKIHVLKLTYQSLDLRKRVTLNSKLDHGKIQEFNLSGVVAREAEMNHLRV